MSHCIIPYSDRSGLGRRVQGFLIAQCRSALNGHMALPQLLCQAQLILATWPPQCAPCHHALPLAALAYAVPANTSTDNPPVSLGTTVDRHGPQLTTADLEQRAAFSEMATGGPNDTITRFTSPEAMHQAVNAAIDHNSHLPEGQVCAAAVYIASINACSLPMCAVVAAMARDCLLGFWSTHF